MRQLRALTVYVAWDGGDGLVEVAAFQTQRAEVRDERGEEQTKRRRERECGRICVCVSGHKNTHERLQ